MNYLETGLSHTDFYPKKTQFSPPRFMPITSLGRKYLGLEPLTRRELDKLVGRLSPPKKQTIETEEPIKLREIRPKTTGTGRFVGEKRMNSLQIEKMVERLYSRRHTKDYAFVEETVVADDILNMANGMSDTSDAEDETKDLKERRNSCLRRQSGSRTNNALDADDHHKREHINMLRRQDFLIPQNSSDHFKSETIHKDSNEIPRLKLDSRSRGSVSFAREVTFAGNKRKISNASATGVPRRRCSDCSQQESRRAWSSQLHSQPPLVEVVRMNRADIHHNKPISRRPKSEPITRQQNADNLLLKLEITDKSDNKLMKSDLESKIDSPGSPRYKQNATAGERCVSQPDSTEKAVSERKATRFAAAPCDELLIDRVATYNRSPRPRRA